MNTYFIDRESKRIKFLECDSIKNTSLDTYPQLYEEDTLEALGLRIKIVRLSMEPLIDKKNNKKIKLKNFDLNQYIFYTSYEEAHYVMIKENYEAIMQKIHALADSLSDGGKIKVKVSPTHKEEIPMRYNIYSQSFGFWQVIFNPYSFEINNNNKMIEMCELPDFLDKLDQCIAKQDIP